MTKENKIKLAQVVCDLQKEIEECNEIERSPSSGEGGLTMFGQGRKEMAEETLEKLLELI